MNTGKKRTRANGEGTIFKNRNRWTVACYDIHGIRRTQSFKKKIEAETWLVEQVTARKRFKGTYVVNPSVCVYGQAIKINNLIHLTFFILASRSA